MEPIGPVATAILGLAATVAGGIAAIAGFGIGSILTPLLAVWLGTKLAVALVAIPHVGATALRFAMLREHLDRRVFFTFGIASALSGLVGALLHNAAGGPALSIVLGALLVFAGVMGFTGWSKKMRFSGIIAWVTGALSGLFGGLVGVVRARTAALGTGRSANDDHREESRRDRQETTRQSSHVP